MTKLKRLTATPRRPSRIPAVRGKWSKLLGVPTTRFVSAWFDPIDLQIVVYAPVENAAWITPQRSYLRTEADQLDETMAYFIFDGKLITATEPSWSTTPNTT